MLQLIPAQDAKEKWIQDYKESFNNASFPGGAGLSEYESIDAWKQDIQSNATLPENSTGKVRSTTFFLMEADILIGMVDIRHFLNDYLLKYGGNIGYSVRKEYRNKGYAKTMLKLALQKCETYGIDKVLITCDNDNIASSKVIEACGGILENIIRNDTEGIREINKGGASSTLFQSS